MPQGLMLAAARQPDVFSIVYGPTNLSRRAVEVVP